jgi:hypothetical protein
VTTWPEPGSWIDVAIKFQTAIAAAVGFSGVILTLLFNAYQARKLERLKQRHERSALISGLSAELSVIRSSTVKNRTNFERAAAAPSATGKFLVPAKATIVDVYEASHARLGLLRPETVANVVRAYTLVKETPSNIAASTGLHDNLPQAGLFAVHHKHATTCAGILINNLEHIDRALTALLDEENQR